MTPVLLFLGAMLLSFLVSLCFLVADREPNAASWCPFAFFLGVPLLSTLGVTFLSFGVSRFYLGVAFASFLPPRCCFLGVTLLSFLGSHFFFLLPFCFQILVLSLCFLSWCLCFLSWCHVAFFLESRLKPDSLSVIDQQPSLLCAWLSVFRTAERD